MYAYMCIFVCMRRLVLMFVAVLIQRLLRGASFFIMDNMKIIIYNTEIRGDEILCLKYM